MAAAFAHMENATMSPRILLVASLLLAARANDSLAQELPGTKHWGDRGDPAKAMVEGIHRFLDRETAASVERRQAKWNRDFSSPEAYVTSIEPNRERFRTIIGAVGERTKPVVLQFVAGPEDASPIAETDKIRVFAARWSVYPGVDAEGLMLEPKSGVKANVVAMADCDTMPEQFAGVTPGLPNQQQVPRLLAEAGCRVLVPALVDRSSEFSGDAKVRFTNLTHREWIYRMAYECGRHIIGYEVDKVRAAVDWFTRAGQEKKPVAVMGHGEGGLIAFYAGAVDPRIDSTWVAGYFAPREGVWKEPVYRNVWGLLDEFGDAEIATLIHPRVYLVESCVGPEIAGPPPAKNGRADAASGAVSTPDPMAVKNEAFRSVTLLKSMVPSRSSAIVSIGGKPRELNDDNESLKTFLASIGIGDAAPAGASSLAVAAGVEPRARMKRQVEQLVEYTQKLMRTSELRRYDYWKKADTSSVGAWEKTTEALRGYFHEEVIGRFPPASEPLEARSVKLYDEPKWTGYGVELPVWPDVVASGILLLPKDLKEGEKRPVVVCQHGLEGHSEDVADPKIKSPYHSYGARLADLGYIVYAPQNPYVGHERFRTLQRKANPLKKSLFSIIVRQHERTLEWLKSLPNVDPKRIAFYGLSYGGKTAMRVPAILPDYCLSICSADFNEWVVKCASVDRPYSYQYTVEYDMYEFGLSEGFNYAEIAGLIAPRPFQVERGHGDGVAPDEWVFYEFAKVKRLYDKLGIGDRTGLAVFSGPHEIHGVETFEFLAKHLNWRAR